MDDLLKKSMDELFWIHLELKNGSSYEGTVVSFDKNTVCIKMQGNQKKIVSRSKIQKVRECVCLADFD